MSLIQHLRDQTDSKVIQSAFTHEQNVQYIDRQYAYIKTLFGPVLEIATKKTRGELEIATMYINNNTSYRGTNSLFCGVYNTFLHHPISGEDPTYNAGMAILIRTYARMKKISELKTSLIFLDRGIYEIYKQKFDTEYRVCLEERFAKHFPQHELARAS